MSTETNKSQNWQDGLTPIGQTEWRAVVSMRRDNEPFFEGIAAKLEIAEAGTQEEVLRILDQPYLTAGSIGYHKPTPETRDHRLNLIILTDYVLALVQNQSTLKAKPEAIMSVTQIMLDRALKEQLAVTQPKGCLAPLKNWLISEEEREGAKKYYNDCRQLEQKIRESLVSYVS